MNFSKTSKIFLIIFTSCLTVLMLLATQWVSNSTSSILLARSKRIRFVPETVSNILLNLVTNSLTVQPVCKMFFNLSGEVRLSTWNVISPIKKQRLSTPSNDSSAGAISAICSANSFMFLNASFKSRWQLTPCPNEEFVASASYSAKI